MNLKEFNSLPDLFFYHAAKQDSESVFLEWLNTVNRKKFTWSETVSNVYKISKVCAETIFIFCAQTILQSFSFLIQHFCSIHSGKNL